MTRKLGEQARAEIIDTVKRAKNRKETRAECLRLSEFYGVNISTIYKLTENVRPQRKKRSDFGKRKADILEDEVLKKAASMVTKYNMDPADALRTVEAEGHEVPISHGTFVRYLNEKGLNRETRTKKLSMYRRFEAKAPGDVFQFDISGMKQRWFDTKTRRIETVSSLDISKNHPNEDPHRIPVWRFVLVDDHSRRNFMDYVPCKKPTSSHVVAFLLDAYQEMGVPKILYTDNDAVIKYGRNQRAAQILDRALEEVGGYKLEQHLPGNSRATGKVEVAHKWYEGLEKVLGLYLDRGRVITESTLKHFAKQMTTEKNNRVHRETGETPMDRWMAQRHLVRTVDAKVLKSAFLIDEFKVQINMDLTFAHKGVIFQIPQNTEFDFENLVLSQSKKNRCKIVMAEHSDTYLLIDWNGFEYEIEKVVATPDVYGDFKTTQDDVTNKARKQLEAFATESAKEEKERTHVGVVPKPIPFIDTETELPETNVAHFPKPEQDVTDEVLEELPAVSKLTSSYAGELITFWDAVHKYEDQFGSKAATKEFLDTIFQSREESEPDAVVRDAMRDLESGQSPLRVAK